MQCRTFLPLKNSPLIYLIIFKYKIIFILFNITLFETHRKQFNMPNTSRIIFILVRVKLIIERKRNLFIGSGSLPKSWFSFCPVSLKFSKLNRSKRFSWGEGFRVSLCNGEIELLRVRVLSFNRLREKWEKYSCLWIRPRNWGCRER